MCPNFSLHGTLRPARNGGDEHPLQLVGAAFGWLISWHKMYCDSMKNVVLWEMKPCLLPCVLLWAGSSKEKNMSHASEWMGFAVQCRESEKTLE